MRSDMEETEYCTHSPPREKTRTNCHLREFDTCSVHMRGRGRLSMAKSVKALTTPTVITSAPK